MDTPPKTNMDTQNDAIFERRYILKKPSFLLSMLDFWRGISNDEEKKLLAFQDPFEWRFILGRMSSPMDGVWTGWTSPTLPVVGKSNHA